MSFVNNSYDTIGLDMCRQHKLMSDRWLAATRLWTVTGPYSVKILSPTHSSSPPPASASNKWKPFCSSRHTKQQNRVDMKKKKKTNDCSVWQNGHSVTLNSDKDTFLLSFSKLWTWMIFHSHINCKLRWCQNVQRRISENSAWLDTTMAEKSVSVCVWFGWIYFLTFLFVNTDNFHLK